MKTRPSFGDLVWMAAGAVVLAICMLLVLHFRGTPELAAQLASRTRRAELVERMQGDLAAASEAEKSAVLATGDRDSQTYADQARDASRKVEEERRELEELLAESGTASERDSLAQFTGVFAELRHIDDDLLALAVKNTNVKAYELAFGPAAAAVGEMSAALSRLVEANADSPQPKTLLRLAFGAEVGALRIQALLPPHIAEEDDGKMDTLEASMRTEDAQVTKDLDGLAALPPLRQDLELATARARYAEFGKVKTQILALSRENTNVRSLSISLNQKRKAMLVCQGALDALEHAILAEPSLRTAYGAPARPR